MTAKTSTVRRIGLIGAPSSAAAYGPGQEKAPAAFRRHGLIPALEGAGFGVTDHGDAAAFRWRPDPERPFAANLPAVRAVCLEIARKVAEVLGRGEFALVLGGDCTIELGVVSGALVDSSSVGLVYVDRDADLNPPADSDGALDWTGVAHLLAIDGADEALARLGPRHPLLQRSDVLYFGLDNLERHEAETIAALDLPVIRRAKVEADPAGAADRAIVWARRFERVLVHLDVDVLDFVDFPFAENVRREPGLTFAALATALGVLLCEPKVAVLTITEANPDHAPDEAAAFGRFNAMLATALAASGHRGPSRFSLGQ